MLTNHEPAPETSSPPRVLLVDDHGELRQGIARYLTFKGFDVVEAESGRAALDAVAAGPPFRFLLTDLSLPDVDGREVADEIRRGDPSIWIAIITGWDVETDELRKWGVDRVFSKPLDLGQLCRDLLEIASEGSRLA